ncbi:MAG: flagellar biosynthetic protein FliR [Thermomicrobiales bacterium]
MLVSADEVYFLGFALVAARVGSAIIVMPFFGASQVPAQIKIALIIILSVVMTPANAGADLLTAGEWFPLMILREILVGLLLGFSVSLVFSALTVAANLISVQMGLNLQALLNPLSAFQADQENALSVFYGLLATVIFLTVNGHHQLLLGIQATFDLVPLNSFTFESSNSSVLAALTTTMIVSAFQIAFPIMAALLIADVAAGLLARMVPQINVFFVNLPVKIFLGFLVMLATMPFTIAYFRDRGVEDSVRNLGRVLGG